MTERLPTLDVPISLIEQIEAGRCVMFVGPEASVPPPDCSGPPGTARLAAELALRVGRQLDDYALPWIAQLYADKAGYHALNDYVAQRLDATQYRPTPSQHLVARLPIQLVVSTAQDRLLLQAFQDQGVPVAHVLTGEALSYTPRRSLIQPYGTATQPETLRLTEDQQRQVMANQGGLAQFLRLTAGTNSVLFLGYALSDPTFRDLYRALRPQAQEHTPRAYAVDEEDQPSEEGYWQQQNLSIIHSSTAEFLEQVARKLIQRGKTPVLPERPCEPPRPLTAQERDEREQILLRLSQELGISSPVESGTQLRPMVNRLAFMRRVLSEQVPSRMTEANEAVAVRDSSSEKITAQILLQQGYAEWAEGNHERGQEFFESAISRAPGLIDAYFSLFYLLVERGRFEEATGVYRQILERAPDQAVLPERYQIQAVLGQSGAGVAYRALDTERGQVVTVTIPRRALVGDKERLEQVGQQLGKLSGEGIARLLGLDRYRGRTYLVTEYLEGETLRTRLKSGAPFSLEEAFRIFDEVALALAEGHRRGVAHLSLTPENIILGQKSAVLINYGITGLLRAAAPGPSGNGGEYASPEQRAGALGDAVSDIYALGTILYEMLAGRHPGVGAFETVSEIRPDVDEAVDVLIARARAFSPSQRYAAIEDMRQEGLRVSGRGGGSAAARYLRRLLVGISDVFARLSSPGGILVLTGTVLIYILAFELWDGLAALKAPVRLGLLILTCSMGASIVGYYVIRETARVRGLGSLVATGRGVGAVFGAVTMLWWFRVTKWVLHPSLQSFDAVDFLGYSFVGLMMAVIATVLFIAIMRGAADRADGWWHRYRSAFYLMFLFLSLLMLVLAWLRWPPGIVEG